MPSAEEGRKGKYCCCPYSKQGSYIDLFANVKHCLFHADTKQVKELNAEFLMQGSLQLLQATYNVRFYFSIPNINPREKF